MTVELSGVICVCLSGNFDGPVHHYGALHISVVSSELGDGIPMGF